VSVGPEPETHFEAWGQAIYQMIPPQGSVQPSTTIVLFAISEVSRRWLGWYTYESDRAIDAALLHYAHELLGERSKFPSHFVARKPITVEELAGPIMHSRGGRPAGTPIGLGAGFQRAWASWGRHGSDVERIEVDLTIEHFYRAKRHVLNHVHLYIRPHGQHALPNEPGIGFVTFLFAEPFDYPTKHINVRRRLQTLRKNLTAR
jgi:hypothetical protein